MLGTHHETWTPDATAIDHANLTAVINDLGFDSYEDLYHWSVESRPEFREMVIDRRGLEWRVVRLDAGDPLPEAEDVSGVAILGVRWVCVTTKSSRSSSTRSFVPWADSAV